MKHVLTIETQIKQYRLPFYQELLRRLRGADIGLRVGYSDPSPTEASKEVTCDLPAEYGVKVKAHWALGERLFFQPLFRPDGWNPNLCHHNFTSMGQELLTSDFPR